jgi:hypothetical protein
LHASLHKEFTLDSGGTRWRVCSDIVPDEEDPHALLSAHDVAGAQVAQVRVAVNFRLSLASATAWVEGGFGKPS